MLIDFADNYKNSDSLIDNWPTLSDELRLMLDAKASGGGFIPKYRKEIQNVLVLLKILPTKASFKQSLKNFILFEKNGTLPNEMDTHPKASQNSSESNIMYPFIVACGEAENAITHFFIDIEGHRMNVKN